MNALTVLYIRCMQILIYSSEVGNTVVFLKPCFQLSSLKHCVQGRINRFLSPGQRNMMGPYI